MALAVHFARANRRNLLVACVGLTMVFGMAFLGIKFIEYAIDYHEGLIPRLTWEARRREDIANAMGQPSLAPASTEAQLFFIFYFVLTGLHALHMIIGLGLMV